MKITRPLFADAATGPIAGLGYFSGPTGKTHFTSPPRYPSTKRGAPPAITYRFTKARLRYVQRPYAKAEPFPAFASRQLKATPAVSLARGQKTFTPPAQQLIINMARLIHEPN